MAVFDVPEARSQALCVAAAQSIDLEKTVEA
jgi:hypothetical protein